MPQAIDVIVLASNYSRDLFLHADVKRVKPTDPSEVPQHSAKPGSEG